MTRQLLQEQMRVSAERLDAVRFVRLRFGFEADEQQSKVLRCGASRLLLCCSRQWGKSSTAAALAAHRAMTEREALVLCVSPTLRQSAEFVRKVCGYLRTAEEKFSGGRLAVYLPNGSRVVALPGQEANVRGPRLSTRCLASAHCRRGLARCPPRSQRTRVRPPDPRQLPPLARHQNVLASNSRSTTQLCRRSRQRFLPPP